MQSSETAVLRQPRCGYRRLIADAAIQTEAFVAVRWTAAFPQQLPVAFVLAQHLRRILVVDAILQQQEIAAQIRSVFKADVAKILTAQDRSVAGSTAPACGLYLVEVWYE